VRGAQRACGAQLRNYVGDEMITETQKAARAAAEAAATWDQFDPCGLLEKLIEVQS